MGELVNFETLPDLSPLAQAALSYASYGFFVFPVWGVHPDHTCMCGEGKHCGSPGKHPIVASGLNASTTAPDTIRKWWRKHPLANIGVNCERSGLFVLDIDPRSGGDESLAKLQKEHGELPGTYEVKTGGGGSHFYFRHTPIKSKQAVAPGVDVKSRGGYVVAPPSMHHSGGTYEAFHIGDPRGFLLDPPAWLVDMAVRDAKPVKEKQKATGGTPKKQADVESGLFGCAFKHAGWLGEVTTSGARAARCPFDESHTTGVRGAPSSSTVVFAPENGGVNGYVQCSHSHCSSRTQTDYWNALPELSRDHARKTLSISVLYDPAASSDPGWLTSWRSSLLFDNKGKLKRVLANASLILKNHKDFAGCLGYNEFAESYHWLRPPPTIMGLDVISAGPVLDRHFVDIGYYLSAKYDMTEFSGDNVFNIMRAAAVPFHPVKQYLSQLEWDERPRVFTWLTKYLGVPDTPYAQAVGCWWLVSAIARILSPGCKADHVLILEGAQGARKSSALRALADPWFADTPINLDSKDAYAALRGVWIYELQELQSLSKADSDKAKAFFSSPVDVYRKPYDRTTVEIKRQCVFAGTVNYDNYLKDPSGNRRYWPVVTNAIDIDALVRDRDQIWAEVLHLYNLGQKWYPETVEQHEMCTVEQQQRLQFEDDPWTPLVAIAVDGLNRVKVYDVLNNSAIFPHARRDQAEANRVGRILRDLGWIKRVTKDGKVWERASERNPNTQQTPRVK